MPDDVHEALSAAADERGLSLTAYVRSELEVMARRSRVAAANAASLRRTKARVGAPVDRETILRALRDGRR